MHYVAGQSLQRRVDVSGPLPIIEALRIAQQTAAGLSAAHAQGLVHRDVKPANILLEEQIDRVLLSDFGLARAVDDASLTRTGIVAGTPHYMSPEQAQGEAIDHRSDLFSLGSVLYFMLTGHPPFRAAGAMAVLHRICQLPHRPVVEVNRDVPMEVSQLIDRLLAKKPSDRLATATQAEAELGQLLTRIQQRGFSIQSAATVHDSALVRAREIIQRCWANRRYRRRALISVSTAACVVALMFSSPLVGPAWWRSGSFFGSGIGAGINTESKVKNQSTANNDGLPTVAAKTRAAGATNQTTLQGQTNQLVPTAFELQFQDWQSAEVRFSQELSEIQRRLLQLKVSDYASPSSGDTFERECESIRRQLEALNAEL